MISAILLSLLPLLGPAGVERDAGAPLPIAPTWSWPGNLPLSVTPIWNWRSDAPRVRVWLEDDRTFRRGDRARVAFRSEDDAYVTVVRVDTDGRMRIIYPERPHYDHRVRGGRTYSVDGPGGGSFTIHDGAGMGYVFAIASWDRFDFDRAYDSHFHQVGYRVRGDPYDAVSGLAEEMLPYRDALYSTHAAEYYVDNHRHYPRYACNECHYGGTHPGHYHPHIYRCSGIQLVIFGGHHHHHYPDYYPYYYYYGSRRIYVRQHRYRPQYEFKAVARGERVTSTDNFIERRTRTVAVDNRRPGSPVPDPNVGDRRRYGGVTPGDGATRPGGSSGGDAEVGTQPGRRRGHESDGPGNSNNAQGRTGDLPRRAGDAGDDSRGRSDDAPRGRESVRPDRGWGLDRGEAPRRSDSDRETKGRDEPRAERRPDRESERRDEPRAERRPDRPEEPRRLEPVTEPRRGEPGRQARDEPTRETRSEPARETRSEPARETRSEPKRETRSEPKRETRSEPKRETRSEPRRETRSEPSRGSGASRPEAATPRRRP